MKKKMLCVLLASVMAVGTLAGCGGGNSSSTTAAASGTTAATSESQASGGQSDTASGDLGDPQTFKFALTVASTHPYSIAAQDFAKIVEEKSGGNMKVELYYDGSLGGDNELMDAMQMNGVTFALMGPAGVQTLCPMYNFFDLPCLFETTDAAYAFQDSEAVSSLLQADELINNGVRGLGFYENGWYLISNNKSEITTIDQLSGMKMRSMTSDMAIKSWEVLGVQPVTMAFSELFVSLQNGTVDGQETTVGSFYSSQFYEVQKYLTQSNRIFHVMTFLMSQQAWDALTEAQQNILMEAVNESSLNHKEYMEKYNEDSINDMIQNYGVTYTDSLAEGEWQKMKDMSASIYDLVKDIDSARYDELMKAADEANAAYPAK